MKYKYWIAVSLFVLSAFHCKKETTNAANFAGFYKGSIARTVNQSKDSVIKNYTIQLVPCIRYDELNMIGSLTVSDSIFLQGNRFVMPAVDVGTNGTVKFTEYGSGQLNGNNFQFEFYQQQIRLSDKTIIYTCKWQGTLMRVQ